MLIKFGRKHLGVCFVWSKNRIFQEAESMADWIPRKNFDLVIWLSTNCIFCHANNSSNISTNRKQQKQQLMEEVLLCTPLQLSPSWDLFVSFWWQNIGMSISQFYYHMWTDGSISIELRDCSEIVERLPYAAEASNTSCQGDNIGFKQDLLNIKKYPSLPLPMKKIN